MANINDFKVLRNKCIKMFDFIKTYETTDEDEKARIGFYHIVLEGIAGIDNPDDIKDTITDTEYNKKMLSLDVDDLGIDAVYISDDNTSCDRNIYLFNFKHVNNFKEATVSDCDISRSMKFIEYLNLSLSDIPKSMGNKVYSKIIKIRKYLESSETCNIFLYMVSNKLGNFAAQSTDHIKILAENYGIKILNISLDEITKTIFNEKKESESKFIVSRNDILSFEGDEKSTKKSFIAKVSLIDIVRILSNDTKLAEKYNLEDDSEVLNTELNLSLLYDNVRGYLEGTTFNKNIKDTLKNNYMNFFMFNNGITITAEEIISEQKNSNQKYLFTLKNFQIVNGGQTVRTIFSYLNDICHYKYDFNYRNTYILVRMFKIEQDNNLKNLIAEYTNSQNKISAYDLKSVDCIQIQIENYLKDNDILYVRKAGNVGDEKIKYKYRISKEELAQIIYAIKGFPDRVTNNKIKLFTDYYNDIFPKDDFNFEKMLSYILNYFKIKKAYPQTKSESIKIFYICYIIYKYNVSIEQAIELLKNFLLKKSSIIKETESRFLIKKESKEELNIYIEEQLRNKSIK